MIRLVSFDCDGVLVDACEWHYNSLNKALQETCGFSLTREEHLSTYNALPTKQKLYRLIEQGRVPVGWEIKIFELKQKYTKECIISMAAKDPVKIEMHAYLKSLGIKVACVTNSITETAKLMLDNTGQKVDLLIANDMVRYPKPHGEGYIRAMIHFGIMPNETLVVEDSPKGMEAAIASGAHTMKVENCSDVTLQNIKPYLEVK